MSNLDSTISRKSDVAYRVVGRYMEGSAVCGYHLVGSDGSQVKATKDRTIYMIGKGLVENMRVQSSENEMIIRGKGVNLTTLPVYDLGKGEFRNNKQYEDIANTTVKPKKGMSANSMGQLEITKRIMYKNKCLGYMIKDRTGKEVKVSRDKVIELGLERLISNATVQKFTNKETNQTKLILRGAGCELNSLPVLIVDNNGKIVDPNKVDSNTSFRAVKMKKAGILYNKLGGEKEIFEVGDYLVCGNNSKVTVIKNEAAVRAIGNDFESESAICDVSLENLEYYPIEVFGANVQNILPNQVLAWQIVKVNDDVACKYRS